VAVVVVVIEDRTIILQVVIAILTLTVLHTAVVEAVSLTIKTVDQVAAAVDPVVRIINLVYVTEAEV
jgi:hypothetical protein